MNILAGVTKKESYFSLCLCTLLSQGLFILGLFKYMHVQFLQKFVLYSVVLDYLLYQCY